MINLTWIYCWLTLIGFGYESITPIEYGYPDNYQYVCEVNAKTLKVFLIQDHINGVEGRGGDVLWQFHTNGEVQYTNLRKLEITTARGYVSPINWWILKKLKTGLAITYTNEKYDSLVMIQWKGKRNIYGIEANDKQVRFFVKCGFLKSDKKGFFTEPYEEYSEIRYRTEEKGYYYKPTQGSVFRKVGTKIGWQKPEEIEND